MRRMTLVGGLILLLMIAFAIARKEPLQRDNWQHEGQLRMMSFSHAKHVKEQGMACEDCHTMAKTSIQSQDNLFAGHEQCQQCHEEQLTSTCNYCHSDARRAIAIPQPRPELVFSHALHLGAAKLECSTCHAGIDSASTMEHTAMPSMSLCMDCHTSKKVSNKCATCHTDFAGLIPDDHLTGDFQRDHKRLTRIASQEISCATCHNESFCQDCHTGDELRSFGETGDLMVEPSPKSGVRDSPRQLRLMVAHDINYRFTHGIDARSKIIDCSRCHQQQQEFCGECHTAGGNLTQGSIRPAWHDEPGFTTIGAGTGGGRHAELARRDLESCIACHDVDGRDPSCMVCHTDGIKVR